MGEDQARGPNEGSRIENFSGIHKSKNWQVVQTTMQASLNMKGKSTWEVILIKSADRMHVIFQGRAQYRDTTTTFLRIPTAYLLSWQSPRPLPDCQAQRIRVLKPALPAGRHSAPRSRIQLQEA